MEDTNYHVGFHSKNGSLIEMLSRGCEITFEKDGIEYNLDNGILDAVDEKGNVTRLLRVESQKPETVLSSKVNGITVEELIQSSHLKSIH